MEKKQTIRCNVEGCKYINDDVTNCTLDEIQVDSIEEDDCNNKDETFCDSYDPKKEDTDDDNE